MNTIEAFAIIKSNYLNLGKLNFAQCDDEVFGSTQDFAQRSIAIAKSPEKVLLQTSDLVIRYVRDEDQTIDSLYFGCAMLGELILRYCDFDKPPFAHKQGYMDIDQRLAPSLAEYSEDVPARNEEFIRTIVTSDFAHCHRNTITGVLEISMSWCWEHREYPACVKEYLLSLTPYSTVLARQFDKKMMILKEGGLAKIDSIFAS